MIPYGDDRHVSDKMIIESGELSDNMLMAQYCIKKQFPLIGGLHSTLMQEKVVIGCTTNNSSHSLSKKESLDNSFNKVVSGWSSECI